MVESNCTSMKGLRFNCVFPNELNFIAAAGLKVQDASKNKASIGQPACLRGS